MKFSVGYYVVLFMLLGPPSGLFWWLALGFLFSGLAGQELWWWALILLFFGYVFFGIPAAIAGLFHALICWRAYGDARGKLASHIASGSVCGFTSAAVFSIMWLGGPNMRVDGWVEGEPILFFSMLGAGAGGTCSLIGWILAGQARTVPV